jgi:hypothetical protein
VESCVKTNINKTELIFYMGDRNIEVALHYKPIPEGNECGFGITLYSKENNLFLHSEPLPGDRENSISFLLNLCRDLGLIR